NLCGGWYRPFRQRTPPHRHDRGEVRRYRCPDDLYNPVRLTGTPDTSRESARSSRIEQGSKGHGVRKGRNDDEVRPNGPFWPQCGWIGGVLVRHPASRDGDPGREPGVPDGHFRREGAVTTARSMTMLRRARTLALAGTLAIGAMIPVVPATLASYDDQTPTVVTTPDQFDIAPDGGLVGLSAVVQTGTGGADLLADPAHDGEVLQRLDDGTVVNLRVDVADTVYDDDGATRWWPVEVGGQEGWVSGFFLVDPSLVEEEEQPSAPPTNRVPYDYTGSMQAEVSADGDGLVLRAE